MDNDISEIRFNDLLFKALDHAIDSIKEGGPLVPFVMTQTNIHRFSADKIEVAQREAEKFMEKKENEALLVLAYDGFVTISEKKEDAILVKGIDKNRRIKMTLAQRYISSTPKKDFEVIGNPVLIAQENL